MSEDIAAILKKEAEDIEANPDAHLKDGTVVVQRGQRSKVFSIRLSESEMEALEKAAERVGAPASTLARAWIAERLAADGDVNDVRSIADALATFSKRLAAL